MKMRSFALLLFSLFFSSALVADDGHHHDPADPSEKLGTVNFPTSCSAGVQKKFERGMALLYSFEYEQAESQFQDAAAIDPQCAMAYWGQAMSLFRQLWYRPTEAELKRGHELLEKAQQLKPATEHEREYIAAIALFYNDAEKLDHRKRVAAYAEAMGKLYRHYPHDREAGVLYALALLTSAPEHDVKQVNERQAVAILTKLFNEQPDHPGIAHYIIHACDNPQMASLGLEAARKYASIAPSSPHAVHMPSHIFARLGLWQEDIDSNLAAIAVAKKMEGMQMHTFHHEMHSVDFLQYAYLQIGDDAKARAVVASLATVSRSELEPAFRDYYDSMQVVFPAHFAIERRQWDEALKLEPRSDLKPQANTVIYWARAIAAGHLHNPEAAADALDHYNALLAEVRKGPKPYIADGLKAEYEVVQAWTFYAQGKNDDALKMLRSVADEQDKTGKSETGLPAREMLADMLLEMNRPADAVTEYEISLKTDPNRFNGLYGAAHAAELLQQKDKAAGLYGQLLKNCAGSNSDRPELEHARTLVAAR